MVPKVRPAGRILMHGSRSHWLKMSILDWKTIVYFIASHGYTNVVVWGHSPQPLGQFSVWRFSLTCILGLSKSFTVLMFRLRSQQAAATVTSAVCTVKHSFCSIKRICMLIIKVSSYMNAKLTKMNWTCWYRKSIIDFINSLQNNLTPAMFLCRWSLLNCH